MAINSCSNIKRSNSSLIYIDGFYNIESVVESDEIEKGYGIIRGSVFDASTKENLSFGEVLIGEEYIEGISIDSLGGFEMLVESGNIKLKIRSVINTSLYIDTFFVKEKTIYTLRIYLGSESIY